LEKFHFYKNNGKINLEDIGFNLTLSTENSIKRI